jgi:uncharacterized protein
MNKVMWFDIPVRDLDAGADFYRTVFGWDVQPRDPADTGGVLGFRVAQTAATSTDGTPQVAGAINGGIVTRDIGIRQPAILVEVEDIEAALERIVGAGGCIVTPSRALPLAGGRFAYFEDPDGNISGLWQWLPG